EIKARQDAWGEALTAAAKAHVPIDTRMSIEGRGSRAGIVRRAIDIDSMPLHPEAFHLHFECAARTFTIETPSEAHIDARVAAQIAAIEVAVQRVTGQDSDVSGIYKNRAAR